MLCLCVKIMICSCDPRGASDALAAGVIIPNLPWRKSLFVFGTRVYAPHICYIFYMFMGFCAPLRFSAPYLHFGIFFHLGSFLSFVVFVSFLSLCSRWSFVNVRKEVFLSSRKRTTYITHWQPSLLLHTAEGRSIDAETHDTHAYDPLPVLVYPHGD